MHNILRTSVSVSGNDNDINAFPDLESNLLFMKVDMRPSRSLCGAHTCGSRSGACWLRIWTVVAQPFVGRKSELSKFPDSIFSVHSDVRVHTCRIKGL